MLAQATIQGTPFHSTSLPYLRQQLSTLLNTVIIGYAFEGAHPEWTQSEHVSPRMEPRCPLHYTSRPYLVQQLTIWLNTVIIVSCI